MNTKFRIKEGYILREIAGEYAIIPVDTEAVISNAVMTPNETAVSMWKVFQEGATVDEVVARMLEEYDASEEMIHQGVVDFVQESLQYNMMEEVILE